MDKSTLSSYGWIIVSVIIIAVMITLATPFAKGVKDNFIGVTNKFTSEAGESWELVEASKATEIVDGLQIFSRGICAYDNVADKGYSISNRVLTIKYPDACKVGYRSQGETSWQEIAATQNDDGSYSFVIPENATKCLLVVKGDYNGNGILETQDVDTLKNILLQKEMGPKLLFVSDVSGDGKITALDLALINAASKNKLGFSWTVA